MLHPSLLLSLALLSGCAYISDKDETKRLDPDGDGVLVGEDCDDNDASVGPPAQWFLDEDGDGYGASDAPTTACARPEGAVAESGDCNDADPTVNPGADDAWYDGVDADCAGDDDYDQDADGYTSADHDGDDCEDTDASVHPDAPDSWYDGVDSDCAGDDDYDQDADGYASADHDGDDCNDTDPAVHPGADEVEGNGLDDDCSGDANGNRWEGAGLWTEAEASWSGRSDDGEGDLAGFRVAGAGDLDGDGAADLMVAAPHGPRNATWLLSGAESDGGLLSREARELSTESVDGGALGLASLGDLNGDGYDDVAIGEYLSSRFHPQGGTVWVVLGPAGVGGNAEDSLLAVSYAALVGPYGGASVGASLEGGSDLTADGEADLLVGAPFDSSSSPAGGRVWVVETQTLRSGSNLMEESPTLRSDGGAGSWFGWDLGVGDIDGDGLADAVVGSPFAAQGTSARGAGAVSVFAGPLTEDRTAEDAGAVTLWGATTNDRLGMSVSSADVDGDGYDDLVVSAVGASSNAGRVYMVPGPIAAGAEVDAAAVLTVQGEAASGFGESLDLGDPDADGRVDLVVGAPEDSSGSGRGQVWVFYGLSSREGTVGAADAADGSFRGPETGSLAGTSVSLVGDTDRDGYGELLVGAPGQAIGDRGAVALFLGGAL